MRSRFLKKTVTFLIKNSFTENWLDLGTYNNAQSYYLKDAVACRLALLTCESLYLHSNIKMQAALHATESLSLCYIQRAPISQRITRAEISIIKQFLRQSVDCVNLPYNQKMKPYRSNLSVGNANMHKKNDANLVYRVDEVNPAPLPNLELGGVLLSIEHIRDHILSKRPHHRSESVDDMGLMRYARSQSIRSLSEFKKQLYECRKVRILYGHLSRKDLYKAIKRAKKAQGSLGENVLIALETRLDVTLQRCAFFSSIFAARQSIIHNRIEINSVNVSTPSYQMQAGDIIKVLPQPQPQPQTRKKRIIAHLTPGANCAWQKPAPKGKLNRAPRPVSSTSHSQRDLIQSIGANKQSKAAHLSNYIPLTRATLEMWAALCTASALRWRYLASHSTISLLSSLQCQVLMALLSQTRISGCMSWGNSISSNELDLRNRRETLCESTSDAACAWQKPAPNWAHFLDLLGMISLMNKDSLFDVQSILRARASTGPKTDQLIGKANLTCTHVLVNRPRCFQNGGDFQTRWQEANTDKMLPCWEQDWGAFFYWLYVKKGLIRDCAQAYQLHAAHIPHGLLLFLPILFPGAMGYKVKVEAASDIRASTDWPLMGMNHYPLLPVHGKSQHQVHLLDKQSDSRMAHVDAVNLRYHAMFYKKQSKPLHLEISYQNLCAIFLYIPQRIYLPTVIDCDVLICRLGRVRLM